MRILRVRGGVTGRHLYFSVTSKGSAFARKPWLTPTKVGIKTLRDLDPQQKL